MTKEDRPSCPHCGEPMLKWQPPSENTWNEPYQYVCFNDECKYYVGNIWSKPGSQRPRTDVATTREINYVILYPCGPNTT
jgi:hypothetical protein